MDIEWLEEGLPEHLAYKLSHRPGKHVEFALALKGRPGVWAKFPENAASTEKSAQSLAQNVNRGVTAGFDKGYFEAVADGIAVVVRCKPEELWPTRGDEPEEPQHDDEGPSAAVVRRWAKAKGMTLPERGRLPREVREAYDADQLAAQRREEIKENAAK